MAIPAENAQVREGVSPAEGTRDDMIHREREVGALAEGAEGITSPHLARDLRPLRAVPRTLPMVGEGVEFAS